MAFESAPARSWISFLIGLCFQLTVSLGLLSFFHGSMTQTLPVHGQTNAGITSFEVNVDGASWFHVGDELPLYRYQSEASFEIGRARITKIEGQSVTAAVVDSSLIFPLGRHGQIADVQDNRVHLSFDLQRPYSVGDRLIVFKGTARVGAVEIVSIATDLFGRGWATAQVVENPANAQTWVGASVSEYTIMTTVSVFPPNPWIWALEIALLLALIAAEAGIYTRFGFGSIAFLLRPIVHAFRKLSTRTRKTILWILVLILVVPGLLFFGQFLVLAANQLLKNLLSGSNWTLSYETWPFVSAALGVTLVTIFIFHRSRSIEFLKSAIGYKPRLRTLVKNPLLFRFIVWFLNLIVVYVFAFTLFGFLSGNLNVAFQYLAPSGIELRSSFLTLNDLSSFLTWFQNTWFNIAQLFQYGLRNVSFDQSMAAVRLILWSLTIAGCMVGYLHSVVKPFFWTSIRNVDFTFAGWLVNGVCYGPLFANALWTLVPSGYYGLYPTVAAGPLFYAIVLMDFATNVLYMLSVWNMGTKFGVMVDKGLVSRGFYSATRHPSYSLESMMFFFAALRGFNSPFHWLGISVIFITYWIRSEREDNFMKSSNPEYVEYRKTVPWKYIPGLI